MVRIITKEEVCSELTMALSSRKRSLKLCRGDDIDGTEIIVDQVTPRTVSMLYNVSMVVHGPTLHAN